MKKITIFLLLNLLIISKLQAQLVQKNHPPELIFLVQKMVNNYPKLKEIQNQITLAEMRTEITKTQAKPIVSGDVSYRYSAPAPAFSIPIPGLEQKVQIQPNSNYNASVSFQQVIYDFGRLKIGIEKSEQEKRNLQNTLGSTLSNYAYQVANIYYNILFLNKSISIKDAEIAQIRELKDLTDKRIKDGDALEFETLTAEVRLNNAINQKTDMQNTLQKQVVLMNSFTGIDNSNLIGKTADLSRMTVLGNSESLVSAAKSNNPDIRNFNERIDVAMHDYELAKKFYYPNIVLSGSAGFRNGFVPNIDVLQGNYVIGVGATIPIYAGDRNKKQIELAKISAESYKATIEVFENTLTKDISLQLADIQAVTEKYKTADTQIKQAQNAFDLANVRFKNGVIKNIDLTDAQTSLIVVQLQKIQYEYQIILAQLEIKRLLAEKFW